MKIKELEIETAKPQQQLQFYKEVLELPIIDFGKKYFQVQVGYSSLLFQENKNATSYHIAFHIPADFEGKALTWLKKRVEIEPHKTGQEKQEIINFSSWNAKSIYFYDEDQNILEFISRKHLWHRTSAEFSAEHILGIAEIGLETSNLSRTFSFLQQQFNLQQYDGNLKKFCPIGDDQGLLITIDKNQKRWFPTNDKAFASSFKIQFQHWEKSRAFIFENNTLKPVT